MRWIQWQRRKWGKGKDLEKRDQIVGQLIFSSFKASRQLLPLLGPEYVQWKNTKMFIFPLPSASLSAGPATRPSPLISQPDDYVDYHYQPPSTNNAGNLPMSLSVKRGQAPAAAAPWASIIASLYTSVLFQNGCVVLLSFVRLPAVSINRQAGSVLNVVLNSAIIPRRTCTRNHCTEPLRNNYINKSLAIHPLLQPP